MDELRNKINTVDSKILELIKERNSVAKEIGDFKKKEGLPVFQPERERAVIEKIESWAKENNIDKKRMSKIWQELMDISKENQN
jgi:chorismate mutase